MTDHAIEALDALATVERAIFARRPEHDIVPSLVRIAALLDLLGQPQRAFPVVLTTGTNGKTSTTRMAEALLRAFGLRTGRFTSPHLHSVRERIALDGEPMDPARFLETYEDIRPYVEIIDSQSAQVGEPKLSFFELLVAMGYAAFADAPVDVAAVEVGLGGAWDATNVADAQVAVIMPISLDHMHFLGSTVEAIATEKAGIIKAGSVAVLAEQEPNVGEILLARAAEVGVTVAREGVEFGVLARQVAVGGQLLALQGAGGRYEEVFLPLHGPHQAHNAAAALAAVEVFLGAEDKPLDIDLVRAGFATVTSPGRLEVIRRSPTIVVDAAHNPAGAAAAAAGVTDAFSFSRLVGLVAVMADKDAYGILRALEPVLAEVVVTQASSARGMPADDLGALAVDVFGADRVEVVAQLPEAIAAAVDNAESGGGSGAGVLVTGSVVTAAEARLLLAGATGPGST